MADTPEGQGTTPENDGSSCWQPLGAIMLAPKTEVEISLEASGDPCERGIITGVPTFENDDLTKPRGSYMFQPEEGPTKVLPPNRFNDALYHGVRDTFSYFVRVITPPTPESSGNGE